MRGAQPVALATAVLLLCAASGSRPGAGRVHGRVTLDVPAARLADLGPIVVFLDGIDGPLHFAVPSGEPTMHQRDARFRPGFLAITVGQSVAMPNDDSIYHNVFSYSKPNDFDLGMYRSGESHRVKFRYPGVVRAYCSIHESMSATIFVAPSPWWSLAQDDGTFEIRGIPAGRYKLRTWAERLPDSEREIRIEEGATLELNLQLLEDAS
jgi:hypothetical protein